MATQPRSANPGGMAVESWWYKTQENRAGGTIGVETRSQYCGPAGRPQGEQWSPTKTFQMLAW